MTTSSLRTPSTFDNQNTSLIISYLINTDVPASKKVSETISRLHAAINPIWEHLLNEPDRYIDTLLDDRIIDFRGSFSVPSTSRLFFKHVYPSLVEIAAMPSEKALLASVVSHLKTNDLFLSIIPKKEGKKSSCAYFSKQGMRFSDDRIQINEIDSCTIEIQYGDDIMRMLCDKDHRWHIGTISKRSVLLHELAHLDNMLQGDFFCHSELLKKSSWAWTNQEEFRVIGVENDALEARGAMRRLGHRSLSFTGREFANMPSTLKLGIALRIGADGTVKELCDRHLAASVESSECIIFNLPEHAPPYACCYLMDYPGEEEVIDEVIDGEFQQVTRIHKNLALMHILQMLGQTENGLRLIQALLESIVTKAAMQRRSDVIPFIQGIQKLYR